MVTALLIRAAPISAFCFHNNWDLKAPQRVFFFNCSGILWVGNGQEHKLMSQWTKQSREFCVQIWVPIVGCCVADLVECLPALFWWHQGKVYSILLNRRKRPWDSDKRFWELPVIYENSHIWEFLAKYLRIGDVSWSILFPLPLSSSKSSI